MYLSVWWLENEVAEEVLHIRHTLLDFNSTEVISHCPLGWVFAVLSAEAPALECVHSTKKVFPSSLKSEGAQVGSTFCLWQTSLWTIFSTDFIFSSFLFPLKLSLSYRLYPLYEFSCSFPPTLLIRKAAHPQQIQSMKRSVHDRLGEDLTFPTTPCVVAVKMVTKAQRGRECQTLTLCHQLGSITLSLI